MQGLIIQLSLIKPDCFSLIRSWRRTIVNSRPLISETFSTRWTDDNWKRLKKKKSPLELCLSQEPLFCPLPSWLAFLGKQCWKVNCSVTKRSKAPCLGKKAQRLGWLKDVSGCKKTHCCTEKETGGKRRKAKDNNAAAFKSWSSGPSGSGATCYQVDRWYLRFPHGRRRRTHAERLGEPNTHREIRLISPLHFQEY